MGQQHCLPHIVMQPNTTHGMMGRYNDDDDDITPDAT
jgi:hypothetical protein